MELFETRPIHFLVKPLDKEKLAGVIDAYEKLPLYTCGLD